MRRTTLSLLAAAGLALTACGGGTEAAPEPQAAEIPAAEPSESEDMMIDDALLEEEIAGEIETALGVAPDGVSCPENVAAQSDAGFECSVDIEQQTLLIDVTQMNGEGDVEYEEADGQVIIVDEEVTEELTDAAYRAVSDGELSVPESSEALAGVCIYPRGEALYIARVGEMLDCAIADEDGNSINVDAEVMEDGSLSYTWAE